MNQFTFIVNPAAGKGGAKNAFDSLRTELASRGVHYDLVETTRPGHATEAARNAVTGTIVSVGGDGTINETVNGMKGSTRSLGIIPAGSGNDFIKSVGIPHKPLHALEVLLEGSTRPVDIGTVRCTLPRDGIGNFETRLFVNGVGAGFDAAVAARTREISYLSGTALYIMAVLQTLGKYAPPKFRIESDSYSREMTGLLIAIGNGMCAGGGFYLTPEAKVDDGLLDVCCVEEKTLFQILRLMPKVMRGKHHDVPGVKFFREKQLTISAEDQFYVHADGEIVGANVRRVEVGLQSTQLLVISSGISTGKNERGSTRSQRSS